VAVTAGPRSGLRSKPHLIGTLRRAFNVKFRKGVTAALAAGALGVAGTAALADEGDRKGFKNGRAIDTEADFTPFERFKPLAASTPCTGEASGRQSQPFLLPPGYRQQVVAEEPPGFRSQGLNQNSDVWDMNTQNEFGKDAGRYVYRTHENRDKPSQVSLTDLKTGRSRILAERADWEAFDGIVWTPPGHDPGRRGDHQGSQVRSPGAAGRRRPRVRVLRRPGRPEPPRPEP